MNRFPAAVWATAFAALIAFMGIGVVDPILSEIGKEMGATQFQVEWLFTSYIAVMALAMLISGVLATRFGGRRVVLIGLAMVVVFATLSGLAPNIGVLAVVRAGWGLGNAFFTSTALSIIVGASSGSMASAITLYEAALGIGMASGPLLGGLLGSFSWRYPFFGAATLMAIAWVLAFTLVTDPKQKEARRTAKDLFRALGHKAVLSNALIGLAYSFSFFTILAYSPLTMKWLGAMSLGWTYFAWGILVGISSVFVVNWLRPLLGPIRLLQLNLVGLILVFVAAGLVHGNGMLYVVVISGFFCGISNAMFTTLAMEVSPFSRSISSGAYNFLRWSGAAVSPILSGWVGDQFGESIPFFIAGALLLLALVGLFVVRGWLEAGLRESGHGDEVHGHGSGGGAGSGQATATPTR
ncbi:MAG: MFS transporter [Alicyclobacillus herbarius]|uniref:MFS transporter n=1 Tax=Alicyclobacillus herbarius TaxID=122960 RepID=UPI0023562F76|nr:MFS transporter [Alicyclobacillus herbarius]MCL6633622.1 MFS transporter [Alicyclobacillus herbarius]